MLQYVRAFGSERILIALNLGATLVASNRYKGRVLVSTSTEYEGDLIDSDIQLDANEGLVIKLAPDVDISSIGQALQST